MPWLLNEDAAMKGKFADLTVTDENAPVAGRPVAVRFRLPETELADVTFPLIVVERTLYAKADDREHRGPTKLPYVPEGVDYDNVYVVDGETGVLVKWETNDPDQGFDVNLSPFWVPEHPIPFNIDYQVTVYSRTQQHLTDLVARLAAVDRIPARFGYLEIPEDGTVRCLDLNGGPAFEESKDQNGKRAFTAVYSIRVTSELNLFDIVTHQTVETVDLELYRLIESLS